MSNWNGQIKFAKVTKQIDYASYPAEMEGAPEIHVWINLDGETMKEFREIQTVIIKSQRIVSQITELDPAKLPERVKEKVKELEDLTPELEKNNQKTYVWFAKVWSQHEDKGTHVTAKEIKKFADELIKAQPDFWDWLQNETYSLIFNAATDDLKN